MKQEHSAGIIVYHIDSLVNLPRYLILHYEAGHWDFPKGIIEPGETDEQAAERELMEEAGLKVIQDHYFKQHIAYTFTNHEGLRVEKTVVFFLGQSDSQEVVLSHEHINYAWLSFDDALKKITYIGARQLLVLAHQYVQKKLAST